MAFGFNDNERRGDDNDRQESGYGQQEGEYGRQNEGSHNASSGGPYGQVPGRFDDNEATNQAMSHYGANDDEHRSMFQNALQSAQNRFQNRRDDDDDDFDEQGAVQAHQSMYDGSGNASASPHNMGAAGAMQALKMFTGGSGNSAPQSQSGFMGMAMAEASKIFDQQQSQGNASGNKESAMQEAAQMALKMYMKSQGGSGGAGGLMSLASKFM